MKRIQLSETELIKLIDRVVSEQTPEELGYVKAGHQGESATWTEKEKNDIISKVNDIHKLMVTPSKAWNK